MVTMHQQADAVVGPDLDTLSMMLEALHNFVGHALPTERMLELDHEDTCPEDLVRAMCGDQLGIQLLFVPEVYGGMGGGSVDGDVRAAQAGLVADMDLVADSLYHPAANDQPA